MPKKAQFRHWTNIISMNLRSNSLCTSGIWTADFIHKGEFSTHNWQSVCGTIITIIMRKISIIFKYVPKCFWHVTRHGTRATCRHVRTLLKYYELHQTPHESKKDEGYFLSWSSLLAYEIPPCKKSRKDASTDSGLGASTQTLVLRGITNFTMKITFVW